MNETSEAAEGLRERRRGSAPPLPPVTNASTRRPGLEGRHAGVAGSAPDPVFAEVDALAFVTDPGSEQALREGLAECRDAQVWPGDLRTTASVLDQGHSARLVFVDLDGCPYPAGAIYDLSTVCEVGTAVIALGSDDTARFSREVLLAGVSDYLVKPVTAAAARESAARALGSVADTSDRGWLVGFAGTGGSGATTLAAATALLAAERGRYVSVLDLNRSFSALSFMLDVEPAGGLVDLLSSVARASLHPEMVDGMRARRSDRIAVYGYPWSAAPPPPVPPVWAVCELFVELQRRSHLVIVDGMDDPATRHALLAMLDARVLVVEPTAAGAALAAGMMTRLGPMLGRDWPVVLVQNHTRAFRAGAGARALGAAGVAAAPDVVVPFEATLPSVTDRGWPRDRLPPALRKPLAALTDRVLAMPGRAAEGPASAPDSAAVRAASRPSPAPAGRDRPAPRSAAPSRMRSALRRLLPFPVAGTRRSTTA